MGWSSPLFGTGANQEEDKHFLDLPDFMPCSACTVLSDGLASCHGGQIVYAYSVDEEVDFASSFRDARGRF